jgi:hypothetical protein
MSETAKLRRAHEVHSVATVEKQSLRCPVQVMEQLSLLDIADKRIGSHAAGGITPENRKKVTIGVELVSDPGLLFLGAQRSCSSLCLTAARRRANDWSDVHCRDGSHARLPAPGADHSRHLHSAPSKRAHAELRYGVLVSTVSPP